MTTDQLMALAKIAAAAVACEKATLFPAAMSVAQCILESAWLTRAPGNNCFGIKATDSNLQYCMTKEYLNGEWVSCQAAFEVYPDLAACFVAHARLLVNGRPYAKAWEAYQSDHDLDGLIYRIAPVYATDPGYAGELLVLAHGPHVTAAIEAAWEAV